MAAQAFRNRIPFLSTAIPAAIVIALAAGIAHQLDLVGETPAIGRIPLPLTVTIPDHPFRYRADGEFYKNGYAVDGPMVEGRIAGELTIMKYQVTEGDYDRCVAAGACAPLDAASRNGDDRPATGINFTDAEAYARWLSAETGHVWRLPTHEEIVYAAGKKFPDDALGIDPDSRNPALRWLADYERETRRKQASDPAPKVIGHFGENEHGLADFAGNVWEWTTTCHRRVDLADGGAVGQTVASCGVYVTVGQHRAPMSYFVRDPKSGGCAVGTPPANLGFRLVRDDRWYAPLLKRLAERGII